MTMSGCMFNQIPTDNLASLSDNKLCSALGENSDNGNTTLRILDEIKSRENVIDMDKCHAIEISVKERISNFRNSTAWSHDLNRMRELNRIDIEMLKTLQKMGKI